MAHAETIYCDTDPLKYFNELQAVCPNPCAQELGSHAWLMINWPFLDSEAEIIRILAEDSQAVIDHFRIEGYTDAAKRLYGNAGISLDDPFSWSWYVASKHHADGEKAEVLVLDTIPSSSDDYRRGLLNTKARIRQALDERCFDIISESGVLPAAIRSCHSPDFERLAGELAIVTEYRA